jgi:hypothetical protein
MRPNLLLDLRACLSMHDMSDDDVLDARATTTTNGTMMMGCGSRAASPQRARLPVEYRHRAKETLFIKHKLS